MEILDAPTAPRATRLALDINSSVCDLASEFSAALFFAGKTFELPAAGFIVVADPEVPLTEP